MSVNTNARITGGIRIITAVLMLGSVVWQMSHRIFFNHFRPGEYFAFFTIDTAILGSGVLLVAGLTAWRGQVESKRLTIARLTIVTCDTIVAVVYNALLRDVPPGPEDVGYQWPVLPNELLHVWVPIIIFLDWLWNVPAIRVRVRAVLWVLVYPLIWLAFSIVRGSIDGWWPYFFIDPSGDAGVGGMIMWIFIIMAALLAVGSGFLLASRGIAKARKIELALP